MTSYEMEILCSVMASLRMIAKEIKRANKLKAIEIKSHAEESTRKAVVEVMEDD